jgi:hypothetical protein
MRKTNWMMMVVLAVAGLMAAGCSGMRLRVTEYQKQTRDTAHRLATDIAQHGTPPGSIAGGVLMGTTREATLDAGPPDAPSDLLALLPASEQKAWKIKDDQVEALTRKATVLLHGLRDTLARLVAYGQDAAVQAAQTALTASADITVPLSPSITEDERAAADAARAAIMAAAAKADADAARRPTYLDVAGTITGEASSWYDLLAPILIGFGVAGVPAAGLWIKKAGEVVQARKDYEQARNSGEQIIRGNAAFMDSKAAKTAIVVDGESVTVEDLLRAALASQDTATRDFVREVKAGK